MNFKSGIWDREINLRDFIVRNYTPYDGDDSFLAPPTARTKALWDKVLALLEQERKAGGVLDIDENGRVNEFREKTQGDGNLINIGFMVCQPEFINYIDGDSTVLEKAPLETVAKLGQLMAYKHEGFWQCMDTLREKQKLESLWESGKAPWKIWED